MTATLLDARLRASETFFAAHGEPIARLCQSMADRFARGGRLLAVGEQSDARHVAVEFVHPVIVGKRALPAIGLADPSALALLARPDDMVIAFGVPPTGAGECLTIGFGVGAEWDFGVPDDDPFVAQEIVETTYHLLWELVHVFFDHAGASQAGGTGASSFLYPFLNEQETDLDAVIADVRASVAMKAEEIAQLRAQTLTDNRDALTAAADAIRACFGAGGKLLAFGNGGSATDAMDLVADLRAAQRPALDLTEDSAILTALANDIGAEVLFARQVIAYAKPGDVAVSLSTSGGSANVVLALQEARRRGLVTVAFVGYDGGRIAAEGLADHVIVTRSQHIPRIQEAQASAYHVLVRLLEG